MSEKLHIIVIVGPTGAGKTTVATYLQNYSQVSRVVTHTTRAPRQGEKNQEDYYFENPTGFYQHHFLEQVTYAGNAYGSSVEGVVQAWQQAPIAVIVLDHNGAQAYLAYFGRERCHIWFVTVSDPNQLIKRLQARGDGDKVVQQRLATIDLQREYLLPRQLATVATVLLNDDWHTLVTQIDKLMAVYTTSLLTSDD